MSFWRLQFPGSAKTVLSGESLYIQMAVLQKCGHASGHVRAGKIFFLLLLLNALMPLWDENTAFLLSN